ncbi:homoserine kinase type II [Evansella vedderi]|uniref:Homoserine kinase type II n=1 Tax=Evansella vedderi TaxID=38282 RepID=A0ABT9ZU90_9BACI|nr:phosphotransferase [Evansella vedderi]MDQ0254804.1 homoserine kinase type II [Evansella vedderi]
MSVDREFKFLIKYFFEEKLPVIVYRGKSGYNNTTRYLEREDKRYILRIYETHNEESKVKLEHEILLKLNQLSNLPFKIPVPVIKDGKSLLRLQSNKIGCIYHYIEGDNPVFNNEEVLFSYGQSVGYLLNALKTIQIQQPLIYRPYYEIEHAHPNCPINKVVEWCSNPQDPYKEYRNELSWIASQLINFKEFIPRIKNLPHQIIHGDLNESNVLVNTDQKINAILDFEFTTRDLRVMEVAVCISEIISEEANEDVYLNKVYHFFSGFGTTMNLQESEIEALPILVQLRRLDVFLHFLGRYLDGKDDASVLEEQIVKAASYQHWLNGSGRKLCRLLENVNR